MSFAAQEASKFLRTPAGAKFRLGAAKRGVKKKKLEPTFEEKLALQEGAQIRADQRRAGRDIAADERRLEREEAAAARKTPKMRLGRPIEPVGPPVQEEAPTQEQMIESFNKRRAAPVATGPAVQMSHDVITPELAQEVAAGRLAGADIAAAVDADRRGVQRPMTQQEQAVAALIPNQDIQAAVFSGVFTPQEGLRLQQQENEDAEETRKAGIKRDQEIQKEADKAAVEVNKKQAEVDGTVESVRIQTSKAGLPFDEETVRAQASSGQKAASIMSGLHSQREKGVKVAGEVKKKADEAAIEGHIASETDRLRGAFARDKNAFKAEIFDIQHTIADADTPPAIREQLKKILAATKGFGKKVL